MCVGWHQITIHNLALALVHNVTILRPTAYIEVHDLLTILGLAEVRPQQYDDQVEANFCYSVVWLMLHNELMEPV